MPIRVFAVLAVALAALWGPVSSLAVAAVHRQESDPCETVFDHDFAQMLLDTNDTGDFVDDYDPDGNGIACDHDGLPNTDGQARLTTRVQADPPSAAVGEPRSCQEFDAWEWAQSVFDTNPDLHREPMDPDQDNIACEDLPIGGFAPVLWADGIPSGAEPAQVVSITDGDTFEVLVNGQVDTVRMYHIDTPERTGFGGGPHCGADSATRFLEYVLGFAPAGTVYLEYDVTQRDDFDRRLAYVWYELDGAVYLVNEVMVRNGFAESETYEPDVTYRDQLYQAEQFSVEKVLGVRLECGRFNQPPGSQPSQEQLAQARRMQPDFGQFSILDVPVPPGDDVSDGPSQQPAAAVQPPAAPAASGDCDPSYPDVCIPPIGQSGDLDCGDVSYRRFTVVPPDPHGFDGDLDGVGCEG